MKYIKILSLVLLLFTLEALLEHVSVLVRINLYPDWFVLYNSPSSFFRTIRLELALRIATHLLPMLGLTYLLIHNKPSWLLRPLLAGVINVSAHWFIGMLWIGIFPDVILKMLDLGESNIIGARWFHKLLIPFLSGAILSASFLIIKKLNMCKIHNLYYAPLVLIIALITSYFTDSPVEQRVLRNGDIFVDSSIIIQQDSIVASFEEGKLNYRGFLSYDSASENIIIQKYTNRIPIGVGDSRWVKQSELKYEVSWIKFNSKVEDSVLHVMNFDLETTDLHLLYLCPKQNKIILAIAIGTK